jgi:nitrogen fixation/metabolism regulation signal transduction histidine kinase
MINFVRMKTKVFSIKMKFTLITILISLVSFGVAAFLSTHWLAKEIEEDYKEKATLMGTHIIHDLEDSMLRRTHEEIFTTLDIYRSYKDVEEVRIFNTKSKEVFVKGESSSEARVEEVIRTGEPLHFYKKMKNREAATFIIPIRNKLECHRCHEKSEPLRGALLLSLNLEGMKYYIGQQEQRFFILFGLIATGTIFATVIAVKRFFLNPLTAIQEGAEAIEKGDFKYRTPVKSKDEIGNLIENFNNMSMKLQGLFFEIEDKNRKLAEQYTLLSRSQKEWQDTFDCITDPIIVIDGDCNIVRANRAFVKTFEEFFVSPHDEPINKRKCYELFGACLLSDCPHKIAMSDRTPTIKEIHGQKTGRIFEVSIFPHDSSGGDFRESIGIFKDVTKRKENEMSLIMSERLVALGQIASGIAHEINNPMATIAACTEGLLKRVRNSQYDLPLFENYLKIIEEEVNRCTNITTSMLSFVRETNNEGKEINIHEVLDKTLEMISFQGRLNKVEVLKNYQKKSLVIHGNEGELRQVFLAVIVNSLDAMQDKGTLTIETRTDGNVVLIRVSDTGHGIPSGLINRIFDPFFSTKSEKGGTGLGLSIADKIIKENNGRIDVISEEGKGTTFTITLPI